jgi:integrase
LCPLEQRKACWTEVAPPPERNLSDPHTTATCGSPPLFNLAVDSKPRSCDLVKLRVRDVTRGDHIASRAIVMQQKTQRPVQFEITEQTGESLTTWISCASRRLEDYPFPSRLRTSPHLSTRQYARIVRRWVREIGLNPAAYGTHTLRRAKATLIYRRTKSLRAVQPLLGHSNL